MKTELLFAGMCRLFDYEKQSWEVHYNKIRG